MSPINYIIIILVAIAVFFAIRRVKKNKGVCDCGCSGNCNSCHVDHKEVK